MAEKSCCSERCVLFSIFVLQAICVLERQIFDFLGYLWLPILVNCIQIIAVIVGFFGTYQYRPKYIVVYVIWSLLYIGWNVFIICFYLNIGVLNRDSKVLSMGTAGESFWKYHGIGCETVYNVTNSGSYPVGTKDCFLDLHYSYVEVIHSGIQITFSVLGFIFGCIVIHIFNEEDDSYFDDDDKVLVIPRDPNLQYSDSSLLMMKETTFDGRLPLGSMRRTRHASLTRPQQRASVRSTRSLQNYRNSLPRDGRGSLPREGRGSLLREGRGSLPRDGRGSARHRERGQFLDREAQDDVNNPTFHNIQTLEDMNTSGGFIPASAIHAVPLVMPAQLTGSLRGRQKRRNSQPSKSQKNQRALPASVQHFDRVADTKSSQRSSWSRTSPRNTTSRRRPPKLEGASDSCTTDQGPERTSTPLGVPAASSVPRSHSRERATSQMRERVASTENLVSQAVDSLQRSTEQRKSTSSKSGQRDSRRRRRNRERAEERERIRSQDNLLAHSPQNTVRLDFDNPGYRNDEGGFPSSKSRTRPPVEPIYASASIKAGRQQHSYPPTPSTSRSVHIPSDASEQPPPYTPFAATSVSNMAMMQNSTSLTNLAKPVRPPVIPPKPAVFKVTKSTAWKSPTPPTTSPPLPPFPPRLGQFTQASGRLSPEDVLPPFPDTALPDAALSHNTTLPMPPPPSIANVHSASPHSYMGHSPLGHNEPSGQTEVKKTPTKEHWSKRRRSKSPGRIGNGTRPHIEHPQLTRGTSSDDSFNQAQRILSFNPKGSGSEYAGPIHVVQHT